jgi:hypothetical protein
MAFVATAATVGGVVGLTGTAAIIGGGVMIGAGVGGLYSAFTGDGDILNSMLTGGLIGGAGAGGLSAMGVGAPAMTAAEAATAAGATGAGTVGPAATTVNTMTAAQAAAATPAQLNALAASQGVLAEGAASLPGLGMTVAPEVVTPAMIEAGKAGVLKTAAGLTGKEMLGYGLAGTTAMQLLGGRSGKGAIAPASATDPGNIRPYEFDANQTTGTGVYPSPYATASYDASGMPKMDTRERNYFDQKYTALTPYSARSGTPDPNKAANGGLMAVGGPVQQMSQNVMGGQGNMFPLSQQEHTNFATPTQMPASAEVIRSDYDTKTEPYTGVMMADGGITYDAITQRYLGLPSSGPVAPVEQLPADLVASLTPQYQAANPNFFSYDAKNQRYGAGIPSMSQLSEFKTMQDKKAAEEAAAAMEAANAAAYQPYDGGGGGAAGGLMPYNLGGYSDGGRLLKGPGDGVSDDIPATIAGKQPARLADGEFVIPARIVSEIGNGSTDAGAKRLYAMMDRIQAGRKKTIGKKNVAKDTKAKKHLLA